MPEHITPHIDYVTPGVKHGVYKRAQTELTKREIISNAIAPPPPPTPEGPEIDIDVKVVPLNCSSYVVDGDCIRGLYNLPAQNSARKVNSNNALGTCSTVINSHCSMINVDKSPPGIYESGENYDKADLKLWIKNFAPYVTSLKSRTYADSH